MIVNLLESKVPKQVFKVNREYRTRTKITKRTIAIGQAFGIGVDEEKRFQVFKDFTFEIKPGDVVLITGDSGSGKSTLLREVSMQISSTKEPDFAGCKVIENNSLSIEDDEPIIQGVGKNVEEAISTLSMAGLNEAFLMLRRFGELSDGQKYRYRIAKMMDAKRASVWIFDEFAALLDRVTAKVVAYTVQKTARLLGKTLVVATTHEDLLEDLKPDVLIQKRFGDAVLITRFEKDSFKRECSLLSQVSIEPCTLDELEGLEKFHYRGKVRAIVKHCFKATLNGEIVSGIVYVCPHLALKGRNIALPEFRGRSNREMAMKVNKEILRISRVIVIPKYRSIGLGAEIVRRTMPLVKKKVVETLAVMSKYNPFFERAGMTRVDVEQDKTELKDLAVLRAIGFRTELLPSRNHTEKVVSRLGKKELEIVKKFALKYCAVAKRRSVALIPRINLLDRGAITEALRLYSTRPVYLYWRDPLIN